MRTFILKFVLRQILKTSDKDIYEKILTKNPVLSNLQEVPVPDDFVKTLLVSQTTDLD